MNILFHRIQRHPQLFLFLAGFFLSAFFSVKGLRLVEPHVHDEFAYVFAADTFLKGRLSNPTPAHAEHFETFHILVEPRYASKYPPGQGLQLALGKLLGHYLIGVWLTMGLIAVCSYRFLLLFAKPSTAFLVALFGLFGLLELGWGSSYLGGSLFALGGLLSLWGSLGFRNAPEQAKHHTWVMVFGLAIMSLTRPMEGLAFALFAGCIWTFAFFSKPIYKKATIGHLVPFGVILLPALCFHIAYNKSITGSYFKLPHVLFSEEFMPEVPLFTWEIDLLGKTKEWNKHPVFIKFQDNQINWLRNYPGDLKTAFRRNDWNLFGSKWFYPGMLLLLFLIALGKLKIEEIAIVGFGYTMLAVVHLVSIYNNFHYYAAWYSLTLFTSALFMQKAAFSERFSKKSQTIFFVGGLFVLFYAIPLLRQIRFVSDYPLAIIGRTMESFQQTVGDSHGRTIFLLSYSPAHNPDNEYIYNAPDIAASPFIWARSLGEAKDAALIDHYKPTTVVRVLADSTRLQVQAVENPDY